MAEEGMIELFSPPEGGFMKFPCDLRTIHDPDTGAELRPPTNNTWLPEAIGGLTTLPSGKRDRIAIIDSGVLKAHSWINHFLEPSGCVDFTGEGCEDQNGHGTVTALLTLAASPEPIWLLSAKVVGTTNRKESARMVQALEWAAGEGVDSVVLSAGVFYRRWGKPTDCDGKCPICRAASQAIAAGVFISAAGGNTPGLLACPATLAKLGHDGILGLGPTNSDGVGSRYFQGSVSPYESQGIQVTSGRPPNATQKRAYLLRSSNPEAAISAYQEMASSADRDEVAYALGHLGELYERQGNAAEAISVYRRVMAMRHSSQSPLSGVRLGNLLRSIGEDAAALNAYQDVIALGNPTYAAMAALNRGNFYLDVGESAKAESSYRLAASFGDQEWGSRALKNLGILQSREGRLDEARQSFGRVLVWVPNLEVASAAWNLGVLEITAGNFEAATTALRLALAVGDSRIRPLAAINLGDALLHLGEKEEARTAYQLAADTGERETAKAALSAIQAL